MTLGFNWSTNTNYSTGPDVGTPTKVDPASSANGFVRGVVAAAQHINYLIGLISTQLTKAVDGIGGGTYTLTAPLRFEGSDVEIAADLEVVSGGAINVANGADITLAGDMTLTSTGDIIVGNNALVTVQSGGVVNLESGGSQNVLPGAQIAVADGADITLAGDMTLTSTGDIIVGNNALVTVESGGVINLESGAAQNVLAGASIEVAGDVNLSSGAAMVGASGSSITIEDQNDLVINNNTENFRLAMTPTYVERVAGAPAWDRTPAAPCGELIQNEVTQPRIIVFPLCLPPGDSVSAIIAQLNGGVGAGHGGDISGHVMPTLALVRTDVNGSQSTVASVTDASASAAAYDASHLVTLTLGPHVIDASYAYYVVITGEDGTTAVANTLGIESIFGQAIARSFRGSANAMGYV